MNEAALLFPGHDFWHYWGAGKLILTGQSAYDVEALKNLLQSMGWQNADPLIGSPPWVLWIFVIFALLPFETAENIWLITCILSLGIFFAWIKFSKPASGIIGFSPSTGMLVFTILAMPAFLIGNVLWGQLNFIIALGLMFFISNRKSGNFFLGGFGLSLTLFKPHLFLPLYAYLLFRPNKGPVIKWCIFWFLFQVSLSAILSPKSFIDYPEEMVRVSGISLGFMAPSFPQILHSYILSLILPLSGVLGGIYLSKRPFNQVCCLLLTLGLLVTPYAWSHVYLFLLPSFIWFLGTSFGRKIAVRLAIIILSYPAHIILCQPRLDFWMIILPLFLFITLLTSESSPFKISKEQMWIR